VSYTQASQERQQASGKAGKCCISICRPTFAARKYRGNLASDTSWMQLTRPSVLFCTVLGYGTRLLLVFLSRLRPTSFAWWEDFLLTTEQQLARLQTSDGRDLILTQGFWALFAFKMHLVSCLPRIML
jgi:hypothetical protein